MDRRKLIEIPTHLAIPLLKNKLIGNKFIDKDDKIVEREASMFSESPDWVHFAKLSRQRCPRRCR